jgi:hypothetical protein
VAKISATVAPEVAPATASPSRPDAGSGAVRDHLNQLRQHGGTYRSIAAAAAVGPTTVHELAAGRRDGTGSIARALLAVTSATLLQGRLDAGGTRLRLRALHVMGHSSARVARAVGASDKTIRRLVRGDAKTVSPKLHDAIADVYDAWWDKRAPGRTRAERTAATIARRRAIAGNWCAAPASTTTNWTAPATAPTAAGNPPPAPAPPRTSASPDDPVGTSAYEQCPPVMTLTILCDRTTHTACLAPGHQHIQGWAAELDLTAPDPSAWSETTSDPDLNGADLGILATHQSHNQDPTN